MIFEDLDSNSFGATHSISLGQSPLPTGPLIFFFFQNERSDSMIAKALHSSVGLNVSQIKAKHHNVFFLFLKHKRTMKPKYLDLEQ